MARERTPNRPGNVHHDCDIGTMRKSRPALFSSISVSLDAMKNGDCLGGKIHASRCVRVRHTVLVLLFAVLCPMSNAQSEATACPRTWTRAPDVEAVLMERTINMYTEIKPWRADVAGPRRVETGVPTQWLVTVDPSAWKDDLQLKVVFIGPTLFAAQSVDKLGNLTFAVQFTMADAGRYVAVIDLHQQYIAKQLPRRMYRWARASASPVEVLAFDRHRTYTGEHCAREIALPQQPCTDVGLAGRYVPCDPGARASCLSSGWTWLPETCHYEMFTSEIVRSKPPLWIAYMGSSVMRGMFYSTMDMLLGGEQSRNLSSAAWFKCWHYLQLELDGFHVSDHDFRSGYITDDPPANWHPNVRQRLKDYTHDRKNDVQRVGQRAFFGELGPDLIVLELSGGERIVPTVLEWLGPAWKGKMVVVPYLAHGWMNPYAPPFEEASVHDARVQYAAWHGLDLAFMHTMENGAREGFSFHYHRACSDGDRHVCGIVTDMCAQMFLNYAFQRANRRAKHGASGPAPTVGFQFCLRCPSAPGPGIAPWFARDDNLLPQCFINVLPAGLVG